MSEKLLKPDKPREITLGGEQYRMSVINWNFLSGIEEHFPGGLTDVGKSLEKKPITTTRKLLWLFLKFDRPGLTEEQVGSLVTQENQAEIVEILSEAVKEIGPR